VAATFRLCTVPHAYSTLDGSLGASLVAATFLRLWCAMPQHRTPSLFGHGWCTTLVAAVRERVKAHLWDGGEHRILKSDA